MTRSEVHCVVLAAGPSQRMGRPKLLLPFRGRTVLEHSVGAALGSGGGRTIVVLGHEAGAAREVLRRAYPDRADLLIVSNPDYSTGQAGSLRVGLQAALAAAAYNPVAPGSATLPLGASAAPRAVVFCLADQPLVTAGTIRSLIDAYLAASDGPAARPRPVVAAPVCEGRRGNPVLVDQSLFPELLTLMGDTGARALLTQLPDGGAIFVPAGREVLIDLDTPEDYRDLVRAFPPTPPASPAKHP